LKWLLPATVADPHHGALRCVTDLDAMNPSAGIYCVRATRYFQTSLSVSRCPVVQNAVSVTLGGERNHGETSPDWKLVDFLREAISTREGLPGRKGEPNGTSESRPLV
jgi:hypothetical protein